MFVFKILLLFLFYVIHPFITINETHVCKSINKNITINDLRIMSGMIGR